MRIIGLVYFSYLERVYLNVQRGVSLKLTGYGSKRFFGGLNLLTTTLLNFVFITASPATDPFY